MRILRRGDVVQAEVTKVFLITPVVRRTYTPWTVSYRFLVYGREYEGNYATKDSKIVDIIEEGQRVHVVYIQEKPEENMLWPFWEEGIILAGK